MADISISDLKSFLNLLLSRRFAHAERFWLSRTLLAPISSMRWSAFIAEFYKIHGNLFPHTKLLSRPLRNYILPGSSPRQRVGFLIQNYTMLSAAFSDDFINDYCSGAALILSEFKSKSDQFRISVCRSDEAFMPREGELTFLIENTVSGDILAKKCVSLGIANDVPSAIIGGMQGSRDGKTSVISSTRRMHGLRPKDALLLAVRVFAREIGLREVHAVSNTNHVIAPKNRSRKFSDYDSYWIERGAKPAEPYGFSMPSEIGPIEGTKARDDLKRQIVAQVRAAVASWRS